MLQRYKVSKCGWEKSTEGFTPCSVATHLQFVKKAISVKHNKMRWLYIFIIVFLACIC